MDGDGALNRTEFDTYIVHTLDSRRRACPTALRPQELTLEEKRLIFRWMQNYSDESSFSPLQQVYASTPTTFDRDEFKSCLTGSYYTKFVAVGRSKVDGTVFGAYAKLSDGGYVYNDHYNFAYIYNTSFFNLNSTTRWTNTLERYPYVEINTYGSYIEENSGDWPRRIIKFNDDLIFKTDASKPNTVFAQYNMTSFERNASATNEPTVVELSSFEVYEVNI